MRLGFEPNKFLAVDCSEHGNPVQQFAGDVTRAAEPLGRGFADQIGNRVPLKMLPDPLRPSRVGHADRSSGRRKVAVHIERKASASDRPRPAAARASFARQRRWSHQGQSIELMTAAARLCALMKIGMTGTRKVGSGNAAARSPNDRPRIPARTTDRTQPRQWPRANDERTLRIDGTHSVATPSGPRHSVRQTHRQLRSRGSAGFQRRTCSGDQS